MAAEHGEAAASRGGERAVRCAAREDARSSPQRPKIRIAPEPFPGEPGGVEIEKRPIRLGQVETVVACSEEAAGYHGLGGFGEEGLVEIAFEARPVVEAHWWGGEELGVFD